MDAQVLVIFILSQMIVIVCTVMALYRIDIKLNKLDRIEKRLSVIFRPENKINDCTNHQNDIKRN